MHCVRVYSHIDYDRRIYVVFGVGNCRRHILRNTTQEKEMNNLKLVGLLVLLFSTSGCYMFHEPVNNPFAPTPTYSRTALEDLSPIARMARSCVDSGNRWDRNALQCRQVAPWKISR